MSDAGYGIAASLAYGYETGRANGVAAERAAIVSWLLREEAELLTPAPFYRTAAKGIERGEHLAGDDA